MPIDHAELKVNWKGDKVNRAILLALRGAVTDTTSDCVKTAKTLSPYKTGKLQGSIQARATRIINGSQVEGRWGSYRVIYAKWVELGTKRRAGRYFLTKSRNRHYPLLKHHLKKRLKRSGS